MIVYYTPTFVIVQKALGLMVKRPAEEQRRLRQDRQN